MSELLDVFLQKSMAFAESPYSGFIKAGIVVFGCALPVLLCAANIIRQHRREVKKHPALSLTYKWQHSQLRLRIVKAFEALTGRDA